MVSATRRYLAFMALLGLERGVECVISHCNTRQSLARGGRESGQGHYGAMVALHALFLVSGPAEVLLLKRRRRKRLARVALGMALGAQALRYWVIGTLGSRWSTRVVVVPGEAPVRTGPYRHLRHPNYLAVAVEMAFVPLLHGAWLTSLVFSCANAALLTVRIPLEERALGAAHDDLPSADPLPVRHFAAARSGAGG